MDMPRRTFDFQGKTVIVVGGSSGINLGVACDFSKAGANVGVISRSPEKVNHAVKLLEENGAKAAGFSADVRNYDALSTGLNELSQQLGAFNVVVSGAAGNFAARGMDMSPNGFAAVINIDLLGTYHVMRASYPYLIKPGSSVINISAPQAFIPMIMQSHVCAAKAGVDMITRTFAMEWGADGIRVNSIVPGPIEGTEGMKRLAPTAALLKKVTDSVPLGRLGQTSDIGRSAMFLASPISDYITGAVIPVDGGWSLGGAATIMEELERQIHS